MGYAPSIVDGFLVDAPTTQKLWRGNESDYPGDAECSGTVTINGTEFHVQETGENQWRQYFIADGIPTEIDGAYKVTALVKASKAVTINVNMGWNWSGGTVGASVAIPQSDDFVEVEWEYSGIGGTSCNLVAQPGTTDAIITWKSLKVEHNAKASRPTTWQQWLTNDGNSIIPGVEHTNKYMGDAEFGAWPEWALAKEDGVNINWRGNRTGEICAWALTKGKNNDSGKFNGNDLDGRARPYPADIVVDPDDATNHVFVVNAEQNGLVVDGDTDASSYKWANQFWIQSPQGWKAGTKVKIKFRYKASVACSVATQIHKENPSDYLFWNAVGSINFTTQWQEFEKDYDFNSDSANGWSLAFNLNDDDTNGQQPITFYFDDLSWETMVLDEGYFVAGANPDEGLEYDLDNAIEFTPDEDGVLVATVGEKGAYVNQIMISTVRGNDAQFKSNTLKPNGSIVNDPDTWLDYAPASIAKLTLPGTGIWKVYIDLEYESMAFEMLEGVVKEPIDVVTNTTANVVHGQARVDLQDDKNAQTGAITVREEADDPNGENVGGEGHTGQTWDNQFFIVANRALVKGEVTVLKFKYKASKEAKTTTQCHVAPGEYKHWGAIGDVTFTTEWQNFEQEFTVPNEADGMKSIAFNMAEIKEACDYEITDVQWYLKDTSLEEGKTWENLINADGDLNFYVKEGAGTAPYVVSGINGVINDAIIGSDVIYNLSGQRVSKDYKGIVIKNGKKVIQK